MKEKTGEMDDQLSWFIEDSKESPFDFKQTELEPVAAFGTNAEVGKDEETGINTTILCIFEMVETRYDGASRVPGSSILEELELII